MPDQKEKSPAEGVAPRQWSGLSIRALVIGATAVGVGLPAIVVGWWQASNAPPVKPAAWLILVAVQLLLLGALLLALLNRRFFRPLVRLQRQASAMARLDGRHLPRPGWNGHDELGQLGRHLNLAHDRIDGLLSELEGSNAELRRLAMVDPLTGLPNRRLFKDLFDHALAVARRANQSMALLFIDLDHFKRINDTLGHPAGDELLRCLGHRLRQATRGSDIVGRLSGDEFVALLPDAHDKEAIGHAALRLIHAVEQPVPLPGSKVSMQVSSSIGIARYPADGQSFDELLRWADQAMYQAKSGGRGRFVFHGAAERTSLPAPSGDAELSLALSRKELQMHYQPVIDIDTGHAVGMEALLRWQHPSRGLLLPARFIRRAEECGHIHAMGQWALRSACAQLQQWKASGLSTGSVAVNLSTAEFRHEHLPRHLAQLISTYSLGDGDLELEVSSHTLMTDPEFTLPRASELRSLGVSLVMEDVGSSMLSLERLGQLCPAKLKIDAMLVSRLPHDSDARATVRAIVALAVGLGAKVAAAGVETAMQRDALAQSGCHCQQGYLFASPEPASNEPAWAAPTWHQPLIANASIRSRPH